MKGFHIFKEKEHNLIWCPKKVLDLVLWYSHFLAEDCCKLRFLNEVVFFV